MLEIPFAVCRCRFADKWHLPFAVANWGRQNSANSAKNGGISGHDCTKINKILAEKVFFLQMSASRLPRDTQCSLLSSHLNTLNYVVLGQKSIN